MEISRSILVALIVVVWSMAHASAEVFEEAGGIVAMEAESTSSKLDAWIKKTDVDGYSGSCHLEFTGNKPENGPPKSKLSYRFKINKAGNYQLTIRARKRLESDRQDISNDCFVAVKGDYTSGNDTPLSILEENTKMYGGNADGWGWTLKLDSKHKKYTPIYAFKEGETYELIIHGRSKNFNIDRILFIHQSNNLKQTQQKNPKESKRILSVRSGASTKRVKRVLKNKQGVEISAELMELKGGVLSVLKSGAKYEIQLKNLSEDDIEFVKKWSEQQTSSQKN